MYRAPSRRRKKKANKIDLVPVLDGVITFIFFLLISANFTKMFEIPSDVPLVSVNEPPASTKPLALTLMIEADHIGVYTGIPSTLRTKVGKKADGTHDLEALHNVLIGIKKSNTSEKAIILEPIVDMTYEEIVKIMDTVRELKNTDEAIFGKSQDGLDVRLTELFGTILFGNIGS